MALLRTLGKNPYIVLLALFALISANTLSSNFIFIDDTNLIVNNPRLNFSLTNLVSIFVKPLGQIHDAAYYPCSPIVAYYRPALNLLYMFNATIWGLNPVGFHITNLLLHLLTSFLVYRIGLLLLDGNRELSLLAAAIFCVHPVHNEIIGRVAMNENLLGCFMAAALYFYLHEDKRLSLIAFTLALLTKESAVMLPFVLLLFELNNQSRKGVAAYLAPYAVLTAIYIGIRASAVGIPDDVTFSVNNFELLLKYCSAIAAYLRLFFLPYPLNIYYPEWKLTSPVQPDLLLTIAIFLFLGFVLWKWRRKPLIIPLLLGSIILLAPVVFNANKLLLGLDSAFIAEKQLYVPSILFSLFIVATINGCKEMPTGKYMIIATILVIPLLVYTTIVSSAAWKSSDTVMTRIIRNYPDSNLAHMGRGNSLLMQGNLDRALTEFKAVLPPDKIDSAALRAQNPGSAAGYQYMNQFVFNNKSLAAYQVQYANVHFCIGQVYLAKNDTDTAIRKFRAALILQPYFFEARTFLARAYMKKGLFRDASREFKFAQNEISLINVNNK
jgi:tetratricopeptide (TPR) repeat protein